MKLTEHVNLFNQKIKKIIEEDKKRNPLTITNKIKVDIKGKWNS